MTERDAAFDPELEFVTDGRVADTVHHSAEAMIRSLADLTSRPITFARVKLHSVATEDSDGRARAQGMIDVSGKVIRAEAEAPTIDQALGLVGERLERRLLRLEGRRQNHRRPPAPEPGEWQSGDLPTERPDFFPRPADERRVMRRKAWGPAEMAIEEALFDLEVLDHRFYLFTDADGEDAVVYEADAGVMYRRASGGAVQQDAENLPVTVNPAPAPELSTEEAIQHLDDSGEPFIFHRDAATGRGQAMYRRYDGHYGLIVPAG